MAKLIVRGFIGIIVASLFFGLDNAFNGQHLPIKQEITDTQIEDVVEISEQNNEGIEYQASIEETIEEENATEEIFSESNTVVSNQSHNQVTEQKIEQSQPVVNSEPVKSVPETNESTNFYDSITGGRHDTDAEPSCKSKGYAIQQAELDDVLDFNELNPDNQKQPIINYTRCYPVIKGGQTLWYLHFFTTQGEGMDDYLKEKYNI